MRSLNKINGDQSGNSLLTEVIYTPESRMRNPGLLVKDMVRDLIAGRGLAWQLAVRDVKAQYRQTFLGLLWALIVPLANTAAWVFLSMAGIVTVGRTDLSYPIYVFVGTILWSVFMDALNAPLVQTSAAQSMLAKINFPREALIMSGILQSLFNAGIKIGLLLAALMIFGIYPDWHLALFPFAVMSLILAGTTIGLLVTPIGRLYADMGKGISLVMQFLMFVTPVVFPLPSGGWALKIVEHNPLTPLILTTRSWLTGFPADHLGQFLFVNLLMFLLFLVVGIIYRITMPILIERMGS